ncbi:hypothetical protein D1007_61469 [Hordeum vulgare]|nr:hypothetical protein D1007_61469 [Hordeum vulgare]
MTHTERISSGAAMEFSMHPMETHMRKMDFTLAYTNDPVMVEDSINTMEWLLAEDDKYKVVGLDLAYTSVRVGHDHKVVITQLCVHHHVLLYNYCLATVPCERFTSTRHPFGLLLTEKALFGLPEAAGRGPHQENARRGEEGQRRDVSRTGRDGVLTLRPCIATPEAAGDERVRGFLGIDRTLNDIYIG